MEDDVCGIFVNSKHFCLDSKSFLLFFFFFWCIFAMDQYRINIIRCAFSVDGFLIKIICRE